MPLVSVIVPSRNEKFLNDTAADLLVKGGDVEVIVILDGYWHDPILTDKRLHYIHWGKAKGMRANINAAAQVARGKFLMKTDAHCMFDEGYDVKLAADCDDNWMVVPRRYSLDAEKWERAPREPYDAMYYFWPYQHPDDLGLHGKPWLQRGRERKDILIDEDVTMQGSCWFMSRKHWDRIGPMSEVGYETFMGEPQELGFKTQFGPWKGAIMRNKKTWYAHLHKGKRYGRMYSMSQSERVRGNAYSWDYWWNGRWPEKVRDLDYLIDKFWPHPGWPDNWKDYWRASEPVHTGA